MTAITAVTSQNTTGVHSAASFDPKEIEKQIMFTCKDIKPDAIKIACYIQQRKSVSKALKELKQN